MQEPAARLLPWSSPNGNPCYLLSDGTGPVSRVADDIEQLQIGMADGLLDHAEYLLIGDRASDRELRFLARGLTDCLRDVRRVAKSRGARLRAVDPSLDDEDGNEGGKEGGKEGGSEA
ncbi:hypothetical protein CP981_23350 [Streptomyces platensis]|uniref:Uncharacterized protein n=1 Tax=Streptomyces platensis TaxID=58346 RepID=A0AAE6TNU5_STRPT|nr:hypothetical protein [Streptomyces platensis]OSY43020.1 hypothetical protein BG653_04617 [Streptomyces platensis]QEV54182.1 hypothetical protein CP981_23350 [Streptomyces platensis]